MARLIEDALPHIIRGKAENTVKLYRLAAEALKHHLKHFEPPSVKGKHVALIKRDYASHPNMGNRVLSVLRLIFSFALEDGTYGVESNPCAGIKAYTEAKRGRLILPSEFAAIREKAVPQLQCIMDMLRLTGQRVSDVLKLRVSDLGEEGIYFRQGKTGTRLIVRWTSELRAVVERSGGLRGNIRALTLFHSRSGSVPSYFTIRNKWERACGLAGVQDAHIHDLRAMALTAAKAQGLDAQALAGHASEAMTKRYLRSKEIPLVNGPKASSDLDA